MQGDSREIIFNVIKYFFPLQLRQDNLLGAVVMRFYSM